MTNRKILDAKKMKQSKDDKKINSVKDAIKKLRSQGWSNKRIAKALNCSENFIRTVSK